jgi:NAD(P)H-dependent flavin oxidoreductase YrpB (nitropropane dioxygenase family)
VPPSAVSRALTAQVAHRVKILLVTRPASPHRVGHFGVNLISNKGADEFAYDHFSDQCHQVVLEEGVPVVVTVGDGPGTYTGSLKEAGIKVVHRPISSTRAAAVEADQVLARLVA